ncbi:GGDEF domain-containing protein [Pseudoalteromonas citrea]|uniref:diguanylate cyclase n=1 Tax=Pseudoalteromonas citrea TaxID=43655 RepID=A0A5S3XM67_9GAMM|nr:MULTISPECIES: GGDEF domain-containing protein [Pseudoalteromonas]RJE76511.1 diguanylate cyclase [Pseudoalteromonas sp. MSK9-3]TMP41275.1 GGDEF domain-containing protein [Pseudoalteromonas citrea]TMP55135.1 GGDEF domain-containing protein [Pseudoalteromonas citrea]
MQEELLNSVIKITKTRDVDSLEYSLISTIQEFIGCKEVAVYKDLQIQGELAIERSLLLKVLTDREYEWEEREVVRQPEPELVSCLQSACIITVQSNDGVERRWLPITLLDKPIGAIAIVSDGLKSSDQVLLNAFCRIFENYLTILHENERDKLTGLLNRQTFEKKLKQLMEKQVIKQHKTVWQSDLRNQHQGATSWLAMVDIDHFKKVNDNYGHVCGDEVLLLLAQKMRQFFRSSDLLFRFGGEEFVMVFEPTDYDSIHKKLAEFMDLVRGTHFPFVKKLTISVGMSRISPYDFPITVLENADKALYYAKENGRDKLCFYEELIANKLIECHQESNDIDLF